MTLDYRFPDTREHRVLQVMAELRNEHVIDLLMAAVKIVVGVPLTLLPSAIVAYLIFFNLHSGRHFVLPFLAVTAVVTPMLVYLERRERQHYLWEAAQEGFEWAILDIILIGPRLLCSLYSQIRLAPPTDETVALAAKIVVELLDADHAVEVRQLRREDRTSTDIKIALDYLEQRGWVCISRRRGWVWLGTSVRRQFAGLAGLRDRQALS